MKEYARKRVQVIILLGLLDIPSKEDDFGLCAGTAE